MNEKKYDKETFEAILDDYMADQGDELNDLEIVEIYFDDDLGAWAAFAKDETARYILCDDGTGNISINYAGEKR